MGDARAIAGERLIAGAMSGTSADGVDVAIVAISGRGTDMRVRLICHRHHAYDAELRRGLFAMRETGGATLSEIAQISRQISLHYAKTSTFALAEAGLEPSQIAAIAAHGQTVYHAPPDTMQLLDPARLAAEARCAVVSDFRRADCAAGGQGAPLVPFADYVLFRDARRTRVLLNIGGIANITVVPAGASLDQVVAFDTGPGNCISDWLCRSRGPFGLGWDVDGGGAARGRVLTHVMDRFLSTPYLARRPPKSTDGPEMIAAFTEAIGTSNHELNDLLATAAYATAATIAAAVTAHANVGTGKLDVIISGGGLRNTAIMGWLRSLLPERVTLRTSSDLAIPADAKEAIAFALLGAATLDGVPSNVPSATGANRAVVLGSITPRP